MKLKPKAGKRVKNQFILNVGDEGAVFSHFADGKLANKLFIDSPFSPDVKLIERLTSAYPKSPIYILVDVIEQNYTQQVLPPVSSIGIRQQIQRRIKRDFQPNDLNNVLPLGRSKEGRKDWNFLFISLANSDPFAKWLELILSQKNDFKGVYLVPVEAMTLLSDINKSSLSSTKTEWELLVLHNKTGGFRIVAFKEGKIIFTRLAQNLIGDNIPDIIVGNMEQEISNTVEYLKRLAFKGEADSKITIVAGADILQKVTPKSLKFGAVELVTPYQLSQKLDLPEAVSEKDKFADILLATHFATARKHLLKFNSAYTKKIEALYNGLMALYVAIAITAVTLLGLSGYEAFKISEKANQLDSEKLKASQAAGRLADMKAKKQKLPKNIDKVLEITEISKMLPKDKFRALRIVNELVPFFNDRKHVLKAISVQTSDDKAAANKSAGAAAPAPSPTPVAPGAPAASTVNAGSFTMELDLDFYISARDQDLLNTKSREFLESIQRKFPNYQVTYGLEPVIQSQSQFEQIIGDDPTKPVETFVIPSKIVITGDF